MGVVSCRHLWGLWQLKEQLSANLDQLAVVHLATKEAKKAWEEEQSYVAEQERRVMASYKEFDGFHCSLKHASQVAYKFGYQIALKRFKARYLELEVNGPIHGTPFSR
ncbi:hypothetical protein B296_00027914 [Ensete ventricosum]|uniref:Uncharacterized protein n=1 Tax=Ensete ventricosum TaxID=4639 RepID=A0A426YWF4_ENSVE|nr:hypothetical protein B296_00027914 [Ensete ventricosum]